MRLDRNALKITVDGQTDVKLFPEEDEPVNILNIKRGIVSALLVPGVEEERNNEMVRTAGVVGCRSGSYRSVQARKREPDSDEHLIP